VNTIRWIMAVCEGLFHVGALKETERGCFHSSGKCRGASHLQEKKAASGPQLEGTCTVAGE
jgi:hypothetical protein